MDKLSVVIDQGTNIRVGYAGESEPRSIFSSIVGRPKEIGSEDKDYYIGKFAEEKESVLKFESPFTNGIITDYDSWGKVYEFIYSDELKTSFEEHPVLITCPTNTPDINKEKLACLMMESYGVPSLYIANKAELITFSVGRLSGFVFDSGETMTEIVPVLEGKAIKDKVEFFQLGGNDINEYLEDVLSTYHVPLTTRNEKKIVEQIKKEMCYVALNYEEETKKIKENEYVLPNGDKIQLNSSIYTGSEIMFNPSFVGMGEKGIVQRCCDIINKFEGIEEKQELFSYVILSGGNTMMKGFYERFTKDIKEIAPAEMKDSLKVLAMPHRDDHAWIGGSIFASVSSYKKKFITKEEYNEFGSQYILEKIKKEPFI